MSNDLPRGLASPARRALAAAGIESLRELAERRDTEVAALHGMGPKAMKTLREALLKAGLDFRS